MLSLWSSWLRREVHFGRRRGRSLAGCRLGRRLCVEALEERSLLSSWSTVAPMPTARQELAAAAGADGRIYAIGGANFVNNVYMVLDTVEAYDPFRNSWSTVAPMPTARHLLAAVAGPDGRIYAIGGEKIGSVLNTVEAYDPFRNSWSTVASMHTARYGLT